MHPLCLTEALQKGDVPQFEWIVDVADAHGGWFIGTAYYFEGKGSVHFCWIGRWEGRKTPSQPSCTRSGPPVRPGIESDRPVCLAW